MEEFSLELSVDRQHLRDAVKGLICTIFFYRAFGAIVPRTIEFLDVPYPYAEIPELDEYIDSKIDQLMAKIDSADTPLLSTTNSTPFGSPPTLKSFSNTTSNNHVSHSNPYPGIRMSEDQIDPLTTVASSMPNSPLVPVNTNNSTIEPATQSINSMPLRSPGLAAYQPPGSRGSALNAPNTHNVKYTQILINFYEMKKLKKPTWFGKVDEEVVFETWLLNIRTIKSLSSEVNIPQDEHFSVEDLQAHFEALIWQISEICDTHKDHLPIIQTTDVLPFQYSVKIKSNGSNESWKEFIQKMLKEPII